MADLPATLQALEEQLLQPRVRHDAVALEALLTTDFVEFGGSGRVFDRQAIVASLVQEQDGSTAVATLHDFAVTVLAAEVALVTYRAVRPHGGASLRSSVWVQREGRWQMRFHQGTRAWGEEPER